MAVEITGATTQVSVGEKITLGVKFTKEWGVLKSVDWSIPGKVIKNYTCNFAQGKLEVFAPPGPGKFAAEFHWVDGADGRVVEAKCVFTASGKDVNKTVSATFDVKRPKLDSYTSATGSVKIDGDKMGLLGPGITWTAKVSPNGARAGLIAFIQQIKPHRVWVPGKKWSSGGVFVLDGAAGKSKIFYAQQTESLSGGTATLTSNDSPSNPLSAFPAALTNTGEDAFKIFVMYQSSAAGSLWVPLGVLAWNWKGEARRASTGDPWAMHGTPSWSVNPSGADTLDFPEWSKYYPNLGYT
ncbi:MAG: hypothetical protein A2V63_10210 [Candidatus Eisenbacteria bacterium RBG_19FT_COMBO_70_11]|nr:MAG: hypothetical protein A2V63_10210 [Candidatus Eisenbacteria bacterium RBG_19FT_COMBO_70_11]